MRYVQERLLGNDSRNISNRFKPIPLRGTLNPKCVLVPSPSLQTPAVSIGDIDVDVYWQPCCSGNRKQITIGSTSLTTTRISPPTTTIAASLNINALSEDCLLNFYDTSIRLGSSFAITYNPGQGKPGMFVCLIRSLRILPHCSIRLG